MAQIGFIGLGVMGGPMARHLAAAGHSLTVFNRTRAKAEAWVAAHGGRVAATPAEAAEGADAVFSCVGADADLEAVTLADDGCFAALAPGALFVDHTTVSAAIARRLAEAGAARGLRVLDAPVSGGQAGAENGTLTIMCGGAEADFAAAEPLMAAYGKLITRIGGAGEGQLAKMCNQLAIAGVLQGLAESLAFAKAAGLDTDKVLAAISGGAASSWQMVSRWPTMAKGEFDFGFAVDWMRKDLGLTLDEARRNGASLPVAALVDQFYGEVQKMGGGRQDTSSLVRRLLK
jgi:3-hydroxyisobutyrate dehydrogenase